MDWLQFIGRFHPLVVHLPIGFLFFGLLLELIGFIKKSESDEMRKIVIWSFLASAIGAMISAAVGLMLAQAGGYDAQALDWHKWMGFALVLLTAGIYLIKKTQWDKKRPAISYSLVILAFVLVSVTGHLGGILTHGSDYLLEHAPPMIKGLAYMDSANQSINIPKDVDSVFVFQHLIQPVLEKKCAGCHNSSKIKGGLDLSSIESLRDGGESGKAFAPGKPMESELVHRVTLPSSSEKFMPPRGTALSYGEITLIKWWIAEGAKDSLQLTSKELPDDLLTILDRDYGLDARPKTFTEKLSAAPISDTVLEEIRRHGIGISRLSPENNLLEIDMQEKIFSFKMATTLEPVIPNIVYIDLARAKIDSQAFIIIPKLKNLIRIDLRNSNVGDEEITQLAALKHLEVINAHGTSISKEALTGFINARKELKIYLWNTRVTEQEIEQLNQQHPQLELIGGALTKTSLTD